jgi:phosphoglycolate phosphatase-like HAD superfamily hydrolase
MALRYRCLILDHDDTAVDSTATIHYPAHLAALKKLRPEHSIPSLETWFLKNFHPGLMVYLREDLEMSSRELEQEFLIWREYTSSRVPRFYPGFLEILVRYRHEGGLIAVVSHSQKDIIARDYLLHQPGVVPDMILGWDQDAGRRKPDPWPVRQILGHFGLEPYEVLIVDDLKPGVLMAEAAGVDIAAAGWGHFIPAIRAYMQAHCRCYLSSVAELGEFILG